jgi:hypothetical protein
MDRIPSSYHLTMLNAKAFDYCKVIFMMDCFSRMFMDGYDYFLIYGILAQQVDKQSHIA